MLVRATTSRLSVIQVRSIHGSHPRPHYSLDISTLHKGYLDGSLTVSSVIDNLLENAHHRGKDAAWIMRIPDEQIKDVAQDLDELLKQDPAGTLKKHPLFGIPFSVKDNIDVAGFPTTAACERFSYTPWDSNPPIEKIIKAGAVLLGKNNMDQFASGLVGCRSPYGIPENPFNKDYVPGGSSSGSGVVVSTGQVTFSIGTDTAGSGRVPAAFTNVVGLKPTKGLFSTRGVVPACRSLDCTSVFALHAEDAWSVKKIMEGFDEEDEYSRRKPDNITLPTRPLRVGTPKQAQFYGWDTKEARALYHEALEIAQNKMGATIVEIDFRPFTETARSLYEGPFIAERLSTLKEFYEANKDACHPVTASILERGKLYSACDTFQAFRRLEKLKKESWKIWKTADIDVLLVPTTSVTPTIHSIKEVPISYNTVLGYYTNFVNLLDMCGMAVPNGFLPSGVPNGVTFLAPAWQDELTYKLGKQFQNIRNLPLGATGYSIPEEYH